MPCLFYAYIAYTIIDPVYLCRAKIKQVYFILLCMLFYLRNMNFMYKKYAYLQTFY